MEYGVRVLRFADYSVVPARDESGFAREVAASAVPLASTNRDPEGDGLPAPPPPAPAWRISMASVGSDGVLTDPTDFTTAFGVVDGDGVELMVHERMSTVRRGETFGPIVGAASASVLPLGEAAVGVSLVFDPARTRAELRAIGAGGHDIVGLIWFVIAIVDELEVSLNGTPVATLARRDTAALDLRTAPIARLALDAPAAGARPAHAASAPLAYLVSIAS